MFIVFANPFPLEFKLEIDGKTVLNRDKVLIGFMGIGL